MPHEPLNSTGYTTKPASGFTPLKITHPGSIRSFIAILTESCYSQIVETHKGWFHHAEWSYICSLNVEKRRKEFVLGRCAGKLAASSYLGESNLSRMIIEPGAFGQPILRFLSDENSELSITHTDGLALAVASRQGHPIGIDIEKLSDRDIGFLKNHITQKDLNLLADVTPNNQHVYLRAWTIKEALSKILRCGITIPFELLELDMTAFIDTDTLCCEYKNFPQYQCYSWAIDEYLIAVTTPRSMSVKIDTELIRFHLKQKVNHSHGFCSVNNGVR